MSNNKDFKVKNGIQPTSYLEGLGTVTSGIEGYSVSGASYDNVNLDVSGQTILPICVFFKADGTKMFTTGASGSTYAINEYTLSTAYDLSTASFVQAFSVAGQETSPNGLWFKPDGTKMYLTGQAGADVNEYDLSTAWSLTSVTFVDSFSFAAQDTAPFGLTFSADGTEMYTCGLVEDDIIQYTLSTAWDVSTASYTRNLVVAGVETLPMDVQFNANGTEMFLTGWGVGLHKYTLTSAYDISTATFDSTSTVTTDTQPEPRGFFMKPDGSKAWFGDGTDKVIYQYSTVLTTNTLDLSTGSVFEITPTSDIQVTLSNPADSGTVSGATLLLDGVATSTYDIANAVYDSVSFSVASQDTSPNEIVFNNDGTKLYVLGGLSDSVHQYTLSTAYDLSTISYDSVSFSVINESTFTSGFAFNNDGTKMYTVGYTTLSIHQYSLSTGFDVSTASYDSVSFDISAQDSAPYSVVFNSDGTKMYLVGNTGDSIYQYSLSTAFDISTASYDSVSFSVASQDAGPVDAVFNSDGTKMYVVGNANDALFQYSLSTAYGISTASYDGVSISIIPQDNNISSMQFSGDGSKMYVLGNATDAIYQYSTATPATITYDTAIEWSGGTAPTSPAIGETDVLTFNTRDGGSTYQGVLAIDGAK